MSSDQRPFGQMPSWTGFLNADTASGVPAISNGSLGPQVVAYASIAGFDAAILLSQPFDPVSWIDSIDHPSPGVFNVHINLAFQNPQNVMLVSLNSGPAFAMAQIVTDDVFQVLTWGSDAAAGDVFFSLVLLSPAGPLPVPVPPPPPPP